MKKLLFLFLSLFVLSVAYAQNAPRSYLDAETKIKYEKIKEKNHFKIDTILKGRVQRDSSWCEGKLKISFIDPSSVKKRAAIEVDHILIGNTFYQNDSSQFLAQIGRTKISNIFDSEIQHESYFNGISAVYSNKDLLVKAGQFLIGSQNNQFGLIGEVSYKLDQYLPLTLTYSVSDWHSSDPFVVSQFSAKYELTNFSIPVDIYAAYLCNHKKSKHEIAAYAGVNISGNAYDHDWNIDLNYQYCGKNAIPRYDMTSQFSGSRVNLKAALAVTDNFSVESKFSFGNSEILEISTVYKW